MTVPDTLAMGKYEGAGNDFLVVVDPSRQLALGPDVARAVCDRHRGVGADGLIRVSRGERGSDADLTMELWNADGSSAEMSGNGMRCLALAAMDAGLVSGGEFTVATAAGVRHVEFRPSESPGEAWASVDMGTVTLGAEPDVPAGARRARLADVGNPHVVLLVDDPDDVDVRARGIEIASGYPGGINVEFVAPRATGTDTSLDFRVWERGAGETLACGTGSVAAAAVAAAWGMVGHRVVVHNPGGALEVVLAAADGESPTGSPTRGARLGGPVRKVADVDAVVTLG